MQTIRKNIGIKIVVLGFCLGFGSCASFDYDPNGTHYQRNYYGPGSQYQQFRHFGGSPYNRYHIPYGSQGYQGRSGGGHNPLYMPSGRYNNIGRPGKWRL